MWLSHHRPSSLSPVSYHPFPHIHTRRRRHPRSSHLIVCYHSSLSPLSQPGFTLFLQCTLIRLFFHFGGVGVLGWMQSRLLVTVIRWCFPLFIVDVPCCVRWLFYISFIFDLLHPFPPVFCSDSISTSSPFPFDLVNSFTAGLVFFHPSPRWCIILILFHPFKSNLPPFSLHLISPGFFLSSSPPLNLS